VRLSIDDFGTGYSSLAYLKNLPADILKIDKSFVGGLGENAEDTAIERMVVDLAHTLGMEVIAEGVERADQLAQLVEMGCDMAQGYFSRARSPRKRPPDLLRAEPSPRSPQGHRPRRASARPAKLCTREAWQLPARGVIS
jgi:EAL domain-containing protein (putative c-di-GMP-specific phosphodiesterase class I)